MHLSCPPHLTLSLRCSYLHRSGTKRTCSILLRSEATVLWRSMSLSDPLDRTNHPPTKGTRSANGTRAEVCKGDGADVT
jgi:hypothetical protein